MPHTWYRTRSRTSVENITKPLVVAKNIDSKQNNLPHNLVQTTSIPKHLFNRWQNIWHEQNMTSSKTMFYNTWNLLCSIPCVECSIQTAPWRRAPDSRIGPWSPSCLRRTHGRPPGLYRIPRSSPRLRQPAPVVLVPWAGLRHAEYCSEEEIFYGAERNFCRIWTLCEPQKVEVETFLRHTCGRHELFFAKKIFF